MHAALVRDFDDGSESLSRAQDQARPEDFGAADGLARPIFVAAPPRAGSRLIAAALAALPGTWTVHGGAGALLSGVRELDPPDGRRGGRLIAEHCRLEVRRRLLAHLRTLAPARAGHDQPSPRLFDASPRNALVVPFLNACFAEARFVYVHRAPADALAESLVLWEQGSATTYPGLPGWTGPPWSFLLVPGWEELIGRPLAEIVTEQWVRTMRILIADLENLPPGRWCVADHDTLLADPGTELERVLAFLSIDPAQAPAAAEAVSGQTAPAAAEARIARAELGPYLGRTEELAARAGDWIAGGPTHAPDL